MIQQQNLVIHQQQNLDIHHELNIDLFAGGGGWSEGVRRASGRNPDIAINHNDDALSMHRANHPDTRHFIADVFEVCPLTVTHGRPVGHLHASPDCTHHSQAAGGQPRNEKRRALSWVVIRWAGQVSPRVITLENVKQVQQWGPLIAKRDKATGRVVTLEMIKDPVTGKMVNRIAAKGERVAREFQYLIPDPKRKGITWRRFVQLLEQMGYEVKTQMMRAADYGAGTTRDRLFLHARNDGLPVTFPEPTHFKNPKRGQKRWSAAHEHINFNLPTKSIFDRKTPLKDATLKRIAKGMKRFVIDNPDPFIVQITQTGNKSGGVRPATEPLPTITTAKGGEFALVSPVMVQAAHGEGSPGGVKRWGDGCKDANEPLGTITASGGQAIAMAHLAQFNSTGNGQPNAGHSLTEPMSTIIAGATVQGLVTAHLCELRNNQDAADIAGPLSTICTSGAHHGLVTAFLSSYYTDESNRCRTPNDPLATITTENRFGLVQCELSPDDEAKALRVAAFLISYYGTDNMSDMRQPMPTITTKDRLAMVTVYFKGTPYLIVDIQFRMVDATELYPAQGFGKDYIITHGHDGRKFSKSTQVRMCGNSVSPYPAEALFRECHKNDDMLINRRKAA